MRPCHEINTEKVIPGMIEHEPHDIEGIHFDSTLVFFARVRCPICRTLHEWFAKEAWACESERQRGPANQNIEGTPDGTA